MEGNDFILINDEDRTYEILNMEAVFLVISYKMELSEEKGFADINLLANEAEANGVPIFGLSASLGDYVEKKRHDYQTPFEFGSMDETTLKTIVRSNPGLILLKKGIVVGKWHFNDVPTFEEAKNQYLK